MIDNQEKQIANKLKLIRANSGISQKPKGQKLMFSKVGGWIQKQKTNDFGIGHKPPKQNQ